MAAPNNNQRWFNRKQDYSNEQFDERTRQKKANEGPPGLDLGELLKQQQYRKLNRIAGYLASRATDVPEVAEVSQALNAALKKQAENPGNKEAAKAQWAEVADKMAAASKSDLNKNGDKAQAWKKFSAISTMGSLNYWVPDQGKSLEVDANMRNMRQTMAARDELSIVAHRGAGPTNRTFGGKIAQNDYRRIENPAENSKQAMDAAYAKMPPATPVGLDGVECDVYMSQDGKAILSHEGAIMEQLSIDQQRKFSDNPPHLDENSRIEGYDQQTLSTIQRTRHTDSNFQSLNNFLESTSEPGRQYFEAKQEAMRVEIEMKGHPAHDPNKDDARNAEDTDEYKKLLTKEVGKNISQFNKINDKKNPGVPHEIVMFNNGADDARKFDELRKYKTRLGNVYTGVGQSNWKETTSQSLETLSHTVDEIRTSVNNVDAVRNNAADLDKFKVTLVTNGDRTRQEGQTAAKLEFGPNDNNTAKKIKSENKRREGIQAKWNNESAEVSKMLEAIRAANGKKNIGLLIDDHTKVTGYRDIARNLQSGAGQEVNQGAPAQPGQGQPAQRHLQAEQVTLQPAQPQATSLLQKKPKEQNRPDKARGE